MISNQTCQICQKSFTRLKHLRRHQLVHDNSRPYQCGVCSKSFARKDGLQRHELIHQGSTTLVQTKGRACASCVIAKTRCTGLLPCQRCVDKNAECTYASTRRSLRLASASPMPLDKPPANEGPTMAPNHSAISNESSEPLPHHTVGLDHAGTFGQPSIHGDSESLIQQVVGRNEAEVHQDPTHPQYASDLLRPDPMDLNEAAQGLLSNPIAPAQYGTVYDQFGWEPAQSPTINWLQMEASTSDFIPMRDFFPTALATDAFSSPGSWHYSIPSPVILGPIASKPAEGSEPNTHSPSESADHAAIPNTVSASACIDVDVERGPYYVDGDKARRTRRKRRRLMTYSSSSYSAEFTFASCTEFPFIPATIDEYLISERQYERLRSHYQSLCVNTSFFCPFLAGELPSREIFHRLIQSYFDSVHQMLPFLHRSTFRGHDRHHTLLLAMAALGARFLEHEAAFSLAAPLAELLRRIMVHLGEDRERFPLSDAELAQVRLLHSISSRYSRDGRPRHDITAIRECTSTFDLVFGQYAKQRNSPRNQDEWLSWVHQEEFIRTKFCIWLVDCMLASHNGSQPTLKLSSVADTQLPCTESLWPTESWEMWDAAKQNSAPVPPTVEKALQGLYIEKQLPPNLGEFARILIIHGLYQRTWDVKEYFQQRLSHFEPSAQRQSSADVPSPLPVWHPKMEALNKWRSAALDCVDILHWNANALIGLAQGMEHPTVLHLHFSRIVLICPVLHVLRLSRFLSETGERRSSSTASVQEAESDLRVVQQWVAQDQYKARLASIHAGVIFWHVRRYSSGAFYEPECVALATLILWAHSRFINRSNQNQGQREDGDSTRPPHLRADCDIILLDRPTDDELVQQYVREGDQMHANMKGVGDLFGPQGAHRVLVQGRTLLSTIGAWQEARTHWVDFLAKLEHTNAGANDLSKQ